MKTIFSSLIGLIFSLQLIAQTPAQDTSIFIKGTGKITIPKSAIIQKDTAGNVLIFITDKQININNITAAPGKKVLLYPDGQLLQIYPLYPQKFKIDTLTIEAKPLSPLVFYPDGKIREIHLAKDYTVNINDTKITFKAGSYIEFYDNGKIEMGLPKYPVSVNINDREVVFKANRPLRFYSNGKILSGFLQMPITLPDSSGNNINIDKDSFIKLNKKGQLVCNR